MNEKDVIVLIEELRTLSNECEWFEFKIDNTNPHLIGEYISALSNSACLANKEFAYIVFGIEDTTHSIIGTSFKPRTKKIGNQELENWLLTQKDLLTIVLKAEMKSWQAL